MLKIQRFQKNGYEKENGKLKIKRILFHSKTTNELSAISKSYENHFMSILQPLLL